MKSLLKLLIFYGFIIIYLLAISSAPQAEFIEPTQTLEGEVVPVTKGRLTVLSEPPGLEIFLDGYNLGKTPAFLLEVEAGSHSLVVKNSKTDIWIGPGKTVMISLYKNEFILIPIIKKKVEERPEIQVPTESHESKTTQPRDQIKTRTKENRKQTIKNWQNFIDGTSPNF